MNKELWQRAEDVAHDLRMLHTLIALVRRYSGRVPPFPVSGELLDIITTIDAIADCARTLSSEQRDKFRGAAFDIEIPFALAREARREFTSEERHRVQETIKKSANRVGEFDKPTGKGRNFPLGADWKRHGVVEWLSIYSLRICQYAAYPVDCMF
jgi:hypothetical protein